MKNRPCQPRTLDFPVTYIGGALRKFVPEWFDKFDWLDTVSPKIDHIIFVVSYVKDDDRFSNLQTIAVLSQRTVETKHERHPSTIVFHHEYR